jgi:hypothetical protein
MRAGLLTIFGVIAIATAIDAGPASANEALAINAASAEAQATTETDLAFPMPARLANEGESAGLQGISEAGAPLTPIPGVTLGEVGYDTRGRAGRIHVVVSGDTLWDISDAYLGTPWVWPSVWTDNQDIENPHLIVPGDRIWVTEHEMRRVTEEEADAMLAREPVEEEIEQPAAAAAAPAPEPEPKLEMAAPVDLPARVVRISSSEAAGFVSAEVLESAASIVDAVPDRVMLSQADRVYVGLGEGDVSVGEQFAIVRTRDRVVDPDTRRLLGFHVDVLGWLEIDELHSDTSSATIKESASEIMLGDRIIPRSPTLRDIEVGPSPQGVDGRITFFPGSRVLMGTIDYVYLNRGELDGLAVGSPLEVYRHGWKAPEVARGTRVDVPNRVIAQLLVVRSQPETAVALVTHTEMELEVGDYFRGTLK